MKQKIIAFLSVAFILLSCNKEEMREIANNPITKFTYVLQEKNGNQDTIYSQVYFLSPDGKVLSEEYTNYLNPQYSHLSTFKYDDKGKLIEEKRNNQVFTYTEWQNDVAILFNNRNNKIGEFTYKGNNLIQHKFDFSNDPAREFNYTYDSNDNLIMKSNSINPLEEYLDYDLTHENPFQLIKSIEILRIYYLPMPKNIYKVNKVYPIFGDDYTTPLSYYDFTYRFDSNNRVSEIEDTKTLIYRLSFSYE